MFVLFPLRVDVPEDRYPVMNWLIMLVTVGVFVLQVRDAVLHETRPPRRPGVSRSGGAGEAGERVHAASEDQDRPPGITGEWMLRGWGLKGLFGYMWLHGGLAHLLGNMWFLWLFGNAVCAKIGNLRYLLLYILMGVTAGVAHLLFSDGPAVGASGAINGIVGMYLVLFFENEIDMFFLFWFIFLYVRRFAVSSVWMILFWLSWDIFGAFVLSGHSNVGYFAHLGGFAAGFGIMLAMCRLGWITVESYERSLVQWWQDRAAGKAKRDPVEAAYAQLGLTAPASDSAPMPEQPAPAAKAVSGGLSHQDARAPSPSEPIRATCSCGNSLSVSGQYAGMVVRCTHCGQRVEIPRVSTPDVSALKRGRGVSLTDDGRIRFACACGRTLKVPARFAGRHGTCPQCGSRLQVPSPSG
jgi:membrane associated rhomboid family serine protease